MGSSFYANKEYYWMNSPIAHAEKITTPLLQWAGKDDPTVPFDQSVSFYMALRRLGLQTILLLYPQGGHYLLKAEQQIDLTKRIMQWFDHFLKGRGDAGWIKAGIIFE
jgi:dipeptidyl aminopeptidase/acylaminoacyl peptidase